MITVDNYFLIVTFCAWLVFMVIAIINAAKIGFIPTIVIFEKRGVLHW